MKEKEEEKEEENEEETSKLFTIVSLSTVRLFEGKSFDINRFIVMKIFVCYIVDHVTRPYVLTFSIITYIASPICSCST